jgi:hypothetical protein
MTETNHPNWRVKLFCCKDGQNWDELGTGYIKHIAEYTFAVHSEINQELIYDWDVDIELAYTLEDGKFERGLHLYV